MMFDELREGTSEYILYMERWALAHYLQSEARAQITPAMWLDKLMRDFWSGAITEDEARDYYKYFPEVNTMDFETCALQWLEENNG